MATEEGKAAARQRVSAEMSKRGWSQRTLAAKAEVDPQTLGDFLVGRRWPIIGTLGKIETALEMTPGTLAALGEDPNVGRPADEPTPAAAHLTDEELLADLTYRLQQLKRQNADLTHEVAELTRDAKRYRAEVEADQAFLIEHSDEPAVGWIADRIGRLNYMAAEESWGSEDAREYREHWAQVRWLRLLQQNAPAWYSEWLAMAALEAENDPDLMTPDMPDEDLAQWAAGEGPPDEPDDDGEAGAPAGPGPKTPPDAPPAPVSLDDLRDTKQGDSGHLRKAARRRTGPKPPDPHDGNEGR